MWATNLKVIGVVLGTLFVYTLICNKIPQMQSEVPQKLSLGANATPEQLVAAGEKVFNGVGGCTACHGLGTRAPNLILDEKGTGPIGARCGKREPGESCKQYLYESLAQPMDYVVPGYQPIMPVITKLMPPEQTWALIAYLESLGGILGLDDEVEVVALDGEVHHPELCPARLPDGFADGLEDPRGPQGREAGPGAQGQVQGMRGLVLDPGPMGHGPPPSFDGGPARSVPTPTPTGGASQRKLSRAPPLNRAIIFRSCRSFTTRPPQRSGSTWAALPKRSTSAPRFHCSKRALPARAPCSARNWWLLSRLAGETSSTWRR
jgi:hypothetical protein